MFEVNNKDTRTMFSIVNFEQVNSGWVQSNLSKCKSLNYPQINYRTFTFSIQLMLNTFL